MKDRLEELLHTKPFAQFEIITTGGQQYHVTTPRLLAVGETQITLYLPRSNKNHIIHLNQIASFHVAQTA